MQRQSAKRSPFPAWPHFGPEEIAAVSRVLQSGKVNQWTGGEVYAFEKEYAQYLGVQHAIALANASVALDLALIALGIGPGDEVIVTPRTFVASVSCVALRGATPIFADVDPDSQNITVESINHVVTPKTKAVIAVHLAGWPCALMELRAWCDEKNIFLIEDCAQAHGARYQGKPVGSFGDVAVFSFCQDKIMTTGGEGGLLVTNNEAVWRRAWSYKDHGKDPSVASAHSQTHEFKWVVTGFGTNYRMTEMQAALGRMMLSKLDDWVAMRRKFAAILNEGLRQCLAVRTTLPAASCFHSYYKYYLFVKPEQLKTDWSRDRILAALIEQGIPCGTGSCPEVYLEAPFKPYCTRRLPVAKTLGETSLMFLVHPTLEASHMHQVVETVRRVIGLASKGS